MIRRESALFVILHRGCFNVCVLFFQELSTELVCTKHEHSTRTMFIDNQLAKDDQNIYLCQIAEYFQMG